MSDVFRGLNSVQGITSPEDIAEAINADFEVTLVDTGSFTHTDDDGNTVTIPIDRHKFVYRPDLKHYYAPVGKSFTITPYVDVLGILREPIENGTLKPVKGGCPNFGERMYMVFEAEGSIDLSAHDKIVNRFTVTSGHDGENKIKVMCTPYRTSSHVIMTQTVSNPLAFKHTKNVNARLSMLRKTLSKVNNEWEEYSENTRKLVTMTINDKQATEFIEGVLGEANSTRAENIQAKVYDIYKTSPTIANLPYTRNTLFGIVQAFCEWGDNYKTVKSSEKRDDLSAKLDARIFGDAAKKKAKAYALALKLMTMSELDNVL